MPEVIDWTALTAAGTVVRRGEAAAPPETAVKTHIKTDVGTLMVVTRPGEQVRPFSRRTASVNGKGAVGSSAVVEVLLDPSRPDLFVRLYLTKDGLVLTTLDL